jgi:signal transduction histidine kinase
VIRRALRRVLPRSLAGRTALFLVLSLMFVQAAGLTIHALDRVDLQRFAQAREISGRAYGLWRTMVLSPPERRRALLEDIDLPNGLEAEIGQAPHVRGAPGPPPQHLMRLFQPDILLSGPPRFRPREAYAGGRFDRMMVSLRMADGEWLNLTLHLPPPRPWHSQTFLAAFVLMTLAALVLILWATRRLTRPVRELALAADRLGRDVNAPPLPEDGPREVATAAHAFNTMAGRIRRFLDDRTQMLGAMSHDLRTPITRMRLRAEFIEDEEVRAKMLSDLAEMETMVNATLAFSRDQAAAEPTVALDLASLCRTVLDEQADAVPGSARTLLYQGPEKLVVKARPVALKRALGNLVQNAVKYGGAARVRLSGPERGVVRIGIEDDGPGIPPELLETVFQPFRRLETSRNRETGGTGLGLPIARNILRAHGGDVTLANRAGGGLTAVATLPV